MEDVVNRLARELADVIAEAGVLTHGPELPPVHLSVDTSGKRKFPWHPEIAIRLPIGKIFWTTRRNSHTASHCNAVTTLNKLPCGHPQITWLDTPRSPV